MASLSSNNRGAYDRQSTDIAIIGGGIAGVSAAYWLARHPSAPSVTVLEAEETLAHHTTGRSAAQLIPNLGAEPLRPLTLASVPFFHAPPEGFAEFPLVTPRAVITVAPPGDEVALDEQLSAARAVDPGAREIDIDEACALFPGLRPEACGRAMLEPSGDDIDVAALHQAFTVGARRAGATIERSWRLETAERSVLEGDASSNGTFERQAGGGWADRWLLGADDGRTLTARLVVNAAGAWGDVVAGICGVAGVGLQPRRRTAFMTPSTFDGSSAWPMVVDVAHRWYAKPDGTQFLCSPADETLSPPCDSKPEELDVALAIDLINQATTLGIRTVSSAWAGLRTFAPDESMVIGPDPEVPSFVWCVGQGGTGIQTAPAAGRLLADLTLDGAPSPFFDPRPETNLAVLDLAALTPERLVRRPVVTA
ncbi:NAD(P)/FAD-dependent oxidoreductase [Candidatus Microthrix sp.]|uniref:NAD(P)/FAD-dependent oxidoreductase n=1 Tax=Candidatus Neomicrothrix sp. TaxID=2719034 RepID=UPI0025932F36|nr:FAD-binding oxidoreductase [Candidatus Microthrix sp.]HMS46913.1 FAD-binding oxidoreductase [Candidatus Microthrix sp.]